MSTPAATLPPLPAAASIKPQAHWQDRLAQALLVVCCAALALFLLGPLFMILVKSVRDKDGTFVGLMQFQEYLATPRLRQSIWNTLWVALIVTGITIPLAFTFAYSRNSKSNATPYAMNMCDVDTSTSGGSSLVGDSLSNFILGLLTDEMEAMTTT